MILQLNSDVNAIVNSNEETDLHLAAKNNLRFSAKYLIKAGADVALWTKPWRNFFTFFEIMVSNDSMKPETLVEHG